MYRVLTDGPACFSNAFSARAFFAPANTVGRGYCARFDRDSAVLCQSEYFCRVSGVSGEAAFVVAGVRVHAHPVILPRFGRADAFRFFESGVAA